MPTSSAILLWSFGSPTTHILYLPTPHVTLHTHYHLSPIPTLPYIMKTLDIPTPVSDTESTPSASDTDSSPPASEKRYIDQLYMAPPQSLARVAVVLRGVDSAFLEKGLFWTSQNLLLADI